MSKPKVAVIIVNYRAWGVIKECVKSLKGLDYTNFEVFIADNSDDSKLFKKESLDPAFDGINLYDAGGNLGFAGGCNFAAKKALDKGGFEWFWFLNPDTIVEKDALSELVKAGLEYKRKGQKVGMIGSKQMFFSDPKKIYSVYKKLDEENVSIPHVGEGEEGRGQYKSKIGVDYVNGSSMFVCKEFIDDIGLMDEEWFLNFEEIDWQEQGKQKGWQIAYCSESKLYHHVSYSIDSFNDGYYMTRNHLYFTSKYFPEKLRTVRNQKIINLIKSTIRLRLKYAKGVLLGLRDFGKNKKGKF